MREICPSCGKDMVVTTETFEVNGDVVRGIPHLLCRSCGEATFTAEQLDMVFGYRTAQKQRSMKTEGSQTLDAADSAEIRFLVDAETLGWLERESARTGISLEKVASAMLRKACNECLCQAGNEQSGTRNLSSLADGLVKRSPSRASAPHPCGGSIPRTR